MSHAAERSMTPAFASGMARGAKVEQLGLALEE
jgi:hypothetical protein